MGTPREIYLRPANDYVAGFVGESNVLSGIVEGEAHDGSRSAVASPIGPLACELSEELKSGRKVTLMLRPDHLIVRGVRA